MAKVKIVEKKVEVVEFEMTPRAAGMLLRILSAYVAGDAFYGPKDTGDLYAVFKSLEASGVTVPSDVVFSFRDGTVLIEERVITIKKEIK